MPVKEERGRGGRLAELNESIVRCRRCPRLTAYREMVAKVKVKRFLGQEYWGRPVPGFGDPHARLLVVGLAPAAHGGNRTGRLFTGDSSGDWLFRAMHETGFCNQPFSVSKHDGLELRSAYVTAVVRCAPPGNRPLPLEIANCNSYLIAEIEELKEVEVILALGRISYAVCLKVLRAESRPPFGHGRTYDLGKGRPKLVASYHPSRQNTQTGRLSWEEWVKVFLTCRRLLGRASPSP